MDPPEGGQRIRRGPGPIPCVFGGVNEAIAEGPNDEIALPAALQLESAGNAHTTTMNP